MRTVAIAASIMLVCTPAMARSYHHHRHHHHIARHHHHDTDAKVADTETSGQFAHMVSSFVVKLKDAFAAIPDGGCHVGSGFRTHAEQAALHRAKPGLAAAPGHSNHERGLAADLSCHGGALAWLHRNAEKFGLWFPMSYEAWHIEPEGATRYARRSHVHYASHHHRHTHYAAG